MVKKNTKTNPTKISNNTNKICRNKRKSLGGDEASQTLFTVKS